MYQETSSTEAVPATAAASVCRGLSMKTGPYLSRPLNKLYSRVRRLPCMSQRHHRHHHRRRLLKDAFSSSLKQGVANHLVKGGS